MRTKIVEKCIKVLKRAIEYPNEESLRFVLGFLEDELELKKQWGNSRHRGSLTKEDKYQMQQGRMKAGLITKPETIKKWEKEQHDKQNNNSISKK